MVIIEDDTKVERWTCPHCGQHTVVTDRQRSSSAVIPLNQTSKFGALGGQFTSYSCANSECREITIDVTIGETEQNKPTLNSPGSRHFVGRRLIRERLRPKGRVMLLPPNVPAEIRRTYEEAVQVAEISGIAGAAMARRCLQGMVRDFWDIPLKKRGKLGAELSSVEDKIDPDLWEDIQVLRSIGDIGAHMDNSVSDLVDVTPDEAGLLLELIETLFREWYVARAKREASRSKLKEMLSDKRQKQKTAKNEARSAAANEAGEADKIMSDPPEGD